MLNKTYVALAQKPWVALVVTAAALVSSGAVSAQEEDFWGDQAEQHQPAPVPGPEEIEALYFSGKFTVNDDDPLSSVPSEEERNAHPLDFGYFLQTLLERGALATERGDHVAATNYYLALAAATPFSAASFRELCAAYQRAGRPIEAEKSCGAVLMREGVTLADYERYVQVALSLPDALSTEQVQAVESVIEHVRGAGVDAQVTADMSCRLGARLQDQKRLSSCISDLRKLGFPEEKLSVYSWSLAMLRGDTQEAKRQLKLAERTDIDRVALEDMSRVTVAPAPASTLLAGQRLLAVAVLGVFACGALLLWQMRRRAHANAN